MNAPHETPGQMIRELHQDDLPALSAMIDALSIQHGTNTRVVKHALARDLLGPNPWAITRIALRNAEPVGYAIGCPLYFAQFGERAMNLHHLYVSPDQRGTGLGTQLTLAMVDMARQLGCTFFSVAADHDNESAQRFYKSLGMRASPVTGLRFAMDL